MRGLVVPTAMMRRHLRVLYLWPQPEASFAPLMCILCSKILSRLLAKMYRLQHEGLPVEFNAHSQNTVEQAWSKMAALRSAPPPHLDA